MIFTHLKPCSAQRCKIYITWLQPSAHGCGVLPGMLWQKPWVLLELRRWEEARGWQKNFAWVIWGLENYDSRMRWKLAPHGFVRLLWLVPYPFRVPSCKISSIALGPDLMFGKLVTPWYHSTTTPSSCCPCWPPSMSTRPATPGMVMWTDLCRKGLRSPVGSPPEVAFGHRSLMLSSWGLYEEVRGPFQLCSDSRSLNTWMCYHSTGAISEKQSMYATRMNYTIVS